jgi:hypothetical protein
MKARIVVSFGLIGVVGLFGCGRNYQGSYTGSKVVTISNQYLYGGNYTQPTNGQTQQQQQSQTLTAAQPTLTLNQGTGEMVTGSWQSTQETGTFTAITTADSLQNVQLSVTPTNNQNQNTTYNQAPSCAAVYVGNLSYADNRISGTLTPQSTSMCGVSSITIDLRKYSQ